jgi:hypothetical protein
MTKMIRIGCGAGFSGDRIDPAIALAKSGNLDYLVFECLAERTIALAQKEKLKDSKKGYDPLLEERFRAVLPFCAANNTKIITNMGAANTPSASEKVKEITLDLGLKYLKVGMVLGDDVLELLRKNNFSDLREPEKIRSLSKKIISANAYLGSEQIIKLLDNKADIILTGRTCDTSLFLGPMIYEFGWKDEDLEKKGWGIAASHLLECAGQVTGGYFADPGFKDVEGLANLGFPILEASDSGEGIITKLPETGGEVSVRTCKEQLLYEVRDPTSYKTADGFSDYTKIKLEQIDKDRVKITGGMGTKPPDIKKVIIGYKNGFLGEAQIAYGGSGAHRRVKLAAQVLLERLKIRSLEFESLRLDFLGIGALWPKIVTSSCLPKEVILRVAARSFIKDDLKKLCNEVEALYTNGPAGGGGVRKFIEESIGVTSSYIPRNIINSQSRILGEKK